MKKMQFKVPFDPTKTDISAIIKALDAIGIKESAIEWSQVREPKPEVK